MSDHHAAILANPSDDAPRLAYAKWLKANGQADRADFIKVQCDRAAKDPHDPAQEKLAKKEKSLLKKHRAAWIAEMPEWATVARFRRGFPILGVDLETFAQRAAELVNITPIEGIELSHRGAPAEGVKALAQCPQAAQFSELLLRFNEVGDEGAKAIAESPYFAGLKTLSLVVVDLKATGVAALAASPYLHGLTSLDITANEIGREGVEALASAPWKLTSLTMNCIPLCGPAMTALANSPVLAALTHLAVGSCQIGPAECEALVASPHLTNLKVLEISDNPFGAVGVRAIVNAPWAYNLTQLHLQASGLDDEAGLILARAPSLSNLKMFPIMNNKFTDVSRTELLERFGTLVVPY